MGGLGCRNPAGALALRGSRRRARENPVPLDGQPHCHTAQGSQGVDGRVVGKKRPLNPVVFKTETHSHEVKLDPRSRRPSERFRAPATGPRSTKQVDIALQAAAQSPPAFPRWLDQVGIEEGRRAVRRAEPSADIPVRWGAEESVLECEKSLPEVVRELRRARRRRKPFIRRPAGPRAMPRRARRGRSSPAS